MPKSRSDRIGGLAESYLEIWTEEAGITKNASQEDRKGWDYILEFSLSDEESNFPHGAALDQERREVKCFVQVKGSDSRKRYEDISLKNWRSLVETDSPAFILRVEFDDKDDPQRAFLRHIDRDVCSDVLKRLREESISEGDADLANTTRRVRFPDECRLESLNGRCLRAKLVEEIGGNPREYPARKREWRKEAGYREAPTKFSGQVVVPDEYKHTPSAYLADFAAGFVDKLMFKEGKWIDNRFNMPVKISTVERGTLKAGSSTLEEITLKYRKKVHILRVYAYQ